MTTELNNTKEAKDKAHTEPRTQLTDAELMRYARQIILPDWDIAAQINLANSRVAVIGLGGLGCPVSQTLARAGVGFFRLVDFDEIEDSNLQRQNLFTVDDVGKNKAVAAAAKLAQHNEFIQLETITDKLVVNNIIDTIADVDLVIDCTDNFSIRDLINKSCVQLNQPFVSAAAIGMEGQLALYDFRDKTQPCYRCVFGDEPEQSKRCSETGVLASTTQVVGQLAAHVALMFLGTGENILDKKLLVWNGKTMQQRSFHYNVDANCTVCQIS